LLRGAENILCIFLVHDLSSDFIHALGQTIPQEIANNMMRVSRLPYGDFMHLVNGSEFMITDGGSNQEEMCLWENRVYFETTRANRGMKCSTK
jgi:UDP-N-acetylglucosamine 2-epimerase (non-hydrolysing)